MKQRISHIEDVGCRPGEVYPTSKMWDAAPARGCEATGRIFPGREEDSSGCALRMTMRLKEAQKDKEAQNDLQKMYILGMIKLT